uniref:Thyrotropin subunit beta n=1 Tax=Erpetoichthys calabaricus TaxID=27687 RepID=A0A8C4X7G2_ERPCA
MQQIVGCFKKWLKTFLFRKMVLACLLCVPTQYTLYVENPECAFCVAVNTTICAGYCMTRDVNVRGLLPRMALSQTVCTYQDLAYRTIRLPGCAPQVNPFYTYPVALTCKCGKCNTDFSDCTQEPTLASHFPVFLLKEFM